MADKRRRDVARSLEDKARKRDQILDAAMKLLLSRGFTATTMSDVAEEAAVGRGTVYWHFESKDDLFYSLVEREVVKVEAMFEMVDVSVRAVASLEGMIRAGFATYGEFPSIFRAFMSVFTGAGEPLEQRLLGLFAQIYGKYNRLFADLLERGKQEGDVRADVDASVVAGAIVVMMDAMYLQVYFGLLENDPGRLADSIISVLRNGYVARPEGKENA